jgi:hypothetical protein
MNHPTSVKVGNKVRNRKSWVSYVTDTNMAVKASATLRRGTATEAPPIGSNQRRIIQGGQLELTT